MKDQKTTQVFSRVSIKSIIIVCVTILALILLYEVSSKAPSNKPLVKSIAEEEMVTIQEKTNEGTDSINDKDDNLSILKYDFINDDILGLKVDNDTDETIDKNDNVLLLANYEEGDILPIVEYKMEKTGYVQEGLNIRENPTTNSKKLGTLTVNTKVRYSNHSKEWVIIKYNGKYAYLSKKYIKNKKVKIKKKVTSATVNANYITKAVMNDRRKSYMDYRCITSRSSRQYKLQYNYAYTGSNGVRMIDGRYCVALGSYYSHNVGQYVDLILANGTVIPCIVSDAKANRDTCVNNAVGRDGSVAEFIVDTPSLSRQVKRMGDISYASNNWNSNVVKIKIYNKNIF